MLGVNPIPSLNFEAIRFIVSYPTNVQMSAGPAQRIPRLGDAGAQCAAPGERPAIGANPDVACRAARGCREPAHLERSALCRVLRAPRVARLMRRVRLQGVPQRRRWRKKLTGVRRQVPGIIRSGTSPQSLPIPMGHGYHRHSDGRTSALSQCSAGFVCGPLGGLFDESMSGPQVDCASRADGVMAAIRPHPGHPGFGSGLSVYLRGVPAVA